MSKALRYAAVTFAACLASGAVAYAASAMPSLAATLTAISAIFFGFLAFCAASED